MPRKDSIQLWDHFGKIRAITIAVCGADYDRRYQLTVNSRCPLPGWMLWAIPEHINLDTKSRSKFWMGTSVLEATVTPQTMF